MRLVLQPDEDAAHAHLLQTAPGAYEWWYFDALSQDGEWALTTIWFLGNPFSPYYRDSLRGRASNPYAHNALFFALYKQGALHAYHFARFPEREIQADAVQPACLRFGPNTLAWDGQAYHLHISDENANRRRVDADLWFQAPPLQPVDVPSRETDSRGDTHCWLPAAPVCGVSGQITLREHANRGAERLRFDGLGYHDHNWGTLPFDAHIKDWYWGRASLGGEGKASGQGEAVLVYHVRYHNAPPVSHLLRFAGGRLTLHDPAARVRLDRVRANGFLMPYATRLRVQSGEVSAVFELGARLDSAPFYARTLCRATVSQGKRSEQGRGLAEYFKPRALGLPLVASATKARIVDHSHGDGGSSRG